MGEQDASEPAEVPETVEQDGAGGPEESGAGYGNNAGYQGGPDAGGLGEEGEDTPG